MKNKLKHDLKHFLNVFYICFTFLFLNCNNIKHNICHLETQKDNIKISIDIDKYDDKENFYLGKLIVFNLSNSEQEYSNAWVSLLINNEIKTRPYIYSMASFSVDHSVIKIHPNKPETLSVSWPLEKYGQIKFNTLDLKINLPY